MATSSWANIDSLLKSYQNDLTQKATGFKNFYGSLGQIQQMSQPGASAFGLPNQNSLAQTPIQWRDITNQANQDVTNRGGPSVMSRVFDVLQRPLYAISEPLRQAAIDVNQNNRIDISNELGAAWKGFSGQKKTDMIDVANEFSYWRDKAHLEDVLKRHPEWTPEQVINNNGEFQSGQTKYKDILKNPTFDPNQYKTPDKGVSNFTNAAIGTLGNFALDPINLIDIFGAGAKGIKLGANAVDKIRGVEKVDNLAGAPYVPPQSRPVNVSGVPENAMPTTRLNELSPIRRVNPILGAISTSAGNKAIRPSLNEMFAASRARAASRAGVLNNIARSYSEPQINEAMKVAQGAIPPTGSNIDTLGAELDKSMRNLIDGSDLMDYARLASNGTRETTRHLIDDLNEELAKHGEKFRFEDGLVENKFQPGTFVDLNGGEKWRFAWKYHKFDDPLSSMSKIAHAVEVVTAKRQFLDDITEQFGSAAKTGSHQYKTTIPRMKGRYFTKEVAQQLDHVDKNWNQFVNPRSSFMKLADEATSLFKTGVTIYNPSHHIRNLIGDVTFNWMDGVNSVRPYRAAVKAMNAVRGRYQTVDELEDLTSKSALTRAMSNGTGRAAVTTKSGITLTPQQLYTAAYEKGLLQPVNIIEDITESMIRPKSKLGKALTRPTGGMVSGKIRKAAEAREHFVRLAHFADLISKSKGHDFDKIITEAANRVRKWHPDGSDLTGFERNYMRRVFPFYSWTRKSIPLVIESVVTKPGKTMAYPKFMQMIAAANGVQSPSISDPFPEDQLFPEWIKEKGIGPIGYFGGNLPFPLNMARSRTGQFGEKQGYVISNPSLPIYDAIAQYGGMGNYRSSVGGIGQMLNPFLRIPAEQVTGSTVFGTPTDYDTNQYITEQIPLLALLSQIGNVGIGGPTLPGQKEGLFNQEAFINWLTAMGLKGTGPMIKQSEFEAKERAKRGEQ